MHITKEDLNYNKLLVAKSYFKKGKFKDTITLLKKIESDTYSQTTKSRLTMARMAELYSTMGFKEHTHRIYNELKSGKWGTCESEILENIKPSEKYYEPVTKFAPPPSLAIEKKPGKKQTISEMIVLAKFHFERRKSQEDAFSILLDLVTENEEKSYTSRKVMFKAAELYDKMGLDYIGERVREDLIKGKWGRCEKEILVKLTPEEKKDLWNKTKDFAKRTINVKPLPDGIIPSVFMMKF